MVTLPAPTGQAGRLYKIQVQAESGAGASAWSQNTGVHDPSAWVRCPGIPPALADADVEAICRYASYIIEAEWDGIADKAADANGDGTADVPDTYTYQVRSDEGDSFTNSPPEWSDPGSGTTSTYTVAQPGRVERELHRRHRQRHPGPRGQLVGQRPLVAGGGHRPELPAHREIDRGRGHWALLAPARFPVEDASAPMLRSPASWLLNLFVWKRAGTRLSRDRCGEQTGSSADTTIGEWLFHNALGANGRRPSTPAPIRPPTRIAPPPAVAHRRPPGDAPPAELPTRRCPGPRPVGGRRCAGGGSAVRAGRDGAACGLTAGRRCASGTRH